MRLRNTRTTALAAAIVIAVAGYAFGVSARLGGTVGVLVGALAMIGWAVRSIENEVAIERRRAGRAYDAMHAGVQIAEVIEQGSGAAVLNLRYGSRQIVFLDAEGRPDSAQATGPGLITVVARLPDLRRRRRLSRLLRERPDLTIIERGVQTGTGRVVRECVLSPADGSPLGTELAASSSFPDS